MYRWTARTQARGLAWRHYSVGNTAKQSFRKNVDDDTKEALDELKEMRQKFAQSGPAAKLIATVESARESYNERTKDARLKRAKRLRKRNEQRDLLYHQTYLKLLKKTHKLTKGLRQCPQLFGPADPAFRRDRLAAVRAAYAKHQQEVVEAPYEPIGYQKIPLQMPRPHRWMTTFELIEHNFHNQPRFVQNLYLNTFASSTFKMGRMYEAKQIELLEAAQRLDADPEAEGDDAVDALSGLTRYEIEAQLDRGLIFAGLHGKPPTAEPIEDTTVATNVMGEPIDATSANFDGDSSSAVVPTGKVREHKVQDPSGGSELVVAPKNWFERQWQNLKDSARTTKVMQAMTGFQQRVEDSDSEFVQRSLEVGGETKDLFARMRDNWFGRESETAVAIGKIREVLPNFDIGEFNDEVQENFVPALLHANILGDAVKCRALFGDAQYRVMMTAVQQRQAANLRYSSMISGIKAVDLLEAKLDGQDVELIYSFQAYQTQAVFDAKGELVEGSEEEIYAIHYVIALRYAETNKLSEHNPLGRWKAQSMQVAGMVPMW